MPNDLVRGRVIEHVRKALSDAKQVADLPHAPSKGYAREIFLKQLLRPLMPPTVSVGTGLIVDSVNNSSGQTDIVIFSRSTMPPLFYDDEFGLFPMKDVSIPSK